MFVKKEEKISIVLVARSQCLKIVEFLLLLKFGLFYLVRELDDEISADFEDEVSS